MPVSFGSLTRPYAVSLFSKHSGNPKHLFEMLLLMTDILTTSDIKTIWMVVKIMVLFWVP